MSVMDSINELLYGKPIDPLNPPPPPVIPEEEKMPHEVYNMVLSRCFDACILNFNHKLLLKSEKECLQHCTQSLKTNGPDVYQRMHQFSGFNDDSASTMDNMKLPGMGGVNGPNKTFSAGFGKVGGGMI